MIAAKCLLSWRSQVDCPADGCGFCQGPKGPLRGLWSDFPCHCWLIVCWWASCLLLCWFPVFFWGVNFQFFYGVPHYSPALQWEKRPGGTFCRDAIKIDVTSGAWGEGWEGHSWWVLYSFDQGMIGIYRIFSDWDVESCWKPQSQAEIRFQHGLPYRITHDVVRKMIKQGRELQDLAQSWNGALKLFTVISMLVISSWYSHSILTMIDFG